MKKQDWREYPERPVVGVGGVILREGRALLIRRGHAPLEGQWSIPGGTLEAGETIIEGVKRELLEETGIEANVGGLIEVFERMFRDEAGRLKYHFVILDYLCAAENGEARAGGDAMDVAWAREDELGRYALTEAATRVLKKAFAMERAKAGAPR